MPQNINRKFASESDLEKYVLPLLKEKYGENMWHFDNSEKRIKTRRGDPDHLFCFYGMFVAVEFKNGATPKKSHEALQVYVLNKIIKAGGFSYRCRTPREVFEAFERLDNTRVFLK